MKAGIIKFLDKTSMMKLIAFIIYFVINFLYLIKYGSRQEKIPIFFLALLFFGAHVLFYVSYQSVLKKIKMNGKMISVAIVSCGIVYIFLSHIMKDPYSLNIDRWQTAEYCLDYWLHGKYIYSTRNFMGNIPSYLPGQLLLLLGFYLLGNVGYMQAAALMLFGVVSKFVFKSFKTAFLAVFMLFFSLTYLYEAICKSDFISSFILTSAFILYWNKKYPHNYFQKPILLGLIVGILFLTRSVVLVPLILFLGRSFFLATLGEKMRFSLTFLGVVSVLLSSVLLPAESVEYILAYNPLGVQGQANVFVMLFFVLITIFLSFIIKKMKHVFFCSSVIVFLLMLSFIVEQIIINTETNFINITYLTAALPFCIISFCLYSEENEVVKV